MYEKAMEHLQASYPDDREGAIFYALAVHFLTVRDAGYKFIP
jgi:hypothetical protein